MLMTSIPNMAAASGVPKIAPKQPLMPLMIMTFLSLSSIWNTSPK